jgi:hypothetical protein
MTGTAPEDSQTYVALWIADDGLETDGDPRADTNGILLLHAEAYGPAGARQVVNVTAAQSPGGGDVRMLAWR